MYVLSAQHHQAPSTSRFLLPCTVTVVTRRRAPAGQGCEDLSVAWCSLCDVTWFGSCQVYLAVPWQRVPPAVLCCLQLPAVGVWSAACRLGHTRLLLRVGEQLGAQCPDPDMSSWELAGGRGAVMENGVSVLCFIWILFTEH